MSQMPKSGDRKKKRDQRIAALAFDRISEKDRRSRRCMSQILLAGELHDAVVLCLKDGKLMPTAALLRSLIDTCVLGIWLLKYATEEQASDSVAHLSTIEIAKHVFSGNDKKMFAFLFQEVRGTDHEFYRDVLHPAIHGDALHLAMRFRDKRATKTWVHKCIFHTNHVYVHFLLQSAGSGLVPPDLQSYIKAESEKSLNTMTALLKHPAWLGIDEHLSE